MVAGMGPRATSVLTLQPGGQRGLGGSGDIRLRAFSISCRDNRPPVEKYPAASRVISQDRVGVRQSALRVHI